MNFQNSILILAIVLLLIGTFVLSYSIKSSIKSKQWPPYIANCPDYWRENANQSCTSLGSNISSGTGCSGTVDFSKMPLCDKYKAANACGIYWDGITYGSNPLVSKCP